MKDYMNEAFDWFLDHHDELVARYNGKVVAIKEGCVLGAYNQQVEAIVETLKTEPIETFIVQKVSPGTDGYTVHVSSPVVSP